MAANSNMDLWNKWAQPPAEALKDFDNGNFKGTDISPMWRIRCLTEEFGPCGKGWYYEIVEHWTDTVETTDIEQCVTTHVRIRLYYRVEDSCDGWSAPVEAVGGNTVTQFSRKHKTIRASDEAYKMALTDAIGGACKLLGIGGKVYWERGYSKYEEYYTKDDTPKDDAPPQVYSVPKAAPAPYNVLQEPDDAIEYRILALEVSDPAKLEEFCMSTFGTDFQHTPIDQLREAIPEATLRARKAKRTATTEDNGND